MVVYDGMQVPDGFDVKDMAGIVFHDRGMDAPLEQVVVDRSTLSERGRRLSEGRRPAAMLVTAFPRLLTEGASITGSTFVVVFLQDGSVNVLDSHRHKTAAGLKGLAWACSSSWDAMVEWLFDPAGLLLQLECRADLLELVIIGSLTEVLPDPTPSIPAGSATLCQSDQEGGLCSHVEHCATCDRCRWQKHGHKFRHESMYVDAATFKSAPAVSVAPDISGGFAIGCTLCARLVSDHSPKLSWRGRRTKWTDFRVAGNGICLDGVRKHLKTSMHMQALQTFATAATAVPMPAQCPQSLHSDADVEGAVPRKSKFADVIRGLCENGCTKSFAEVDSPLIVTGVCRDESRAARRKMITAAAAVLDDQQTDNLQ